MKVGAWGVLVVLCAGCANPTIFTATVVTSATQNTTVGGQAQLVVMVTNTGPAIPHLGLVFLSADKWYDHHTVSDLGGCTLALDSSAFDCGDLKSGQTVTYTIAGTAKVPAPFTMRWRCGSWSSRTTSSTITPPAPTSRSGTRQLCRLADMPY